MRLYKICVDKLKRTNMSTMGWLILVGVFAVLWYYVDNYIIYTLNSDHSSDLILGHMLAEENRIITPNWCYSTVLKVIDINLIWAILFKFTDNWHTVRVLGSIIIYLLMLACLWFLCNKAGLRKYFGYIGAVMLLPISEDYFDIVMRGVYYAATIITSLLTMGMCIAFTNENSNKKRLVLMIAGILISIAGGLCGPMQLIMFNVPMVFAAVLCFFIERDKNKTKLAAFALIMALATVSGYLFYSGVLAKIYEVQSYEDQMFQALSIAGIMDVINGWIGVFGYRTGESIFSSALLFNAVAGIWVLLSIICSVLTLKSDEHGISAKFIAAVYLSYLVTMVLVFSMSNKIFIPRYMIMSVIFGALAVFTYFAYSSKKRENNRKFVAGFMALVLLCGALSYNEMRKVDNTKGQREAVQALVEQGYTQGYATFWNANVLTELSNGQLELWHWNDGKQEIASLEDFNDIYPWLQSKSHLTTVPSGKVFVLLSANEDYYFEFTKKFSQENVIYRADNYYDYGYKDYIAYGFESYEELAQLLSK